MFLKKATSKKTGRTYLSIVHGYRNSQGKSATRTIQSIGYLDELLLKYDDPIAHFTAVAAKMEEERLAAKTIEFSLLTDARVPQDHVNRKNYGFLVLSQIYHELEIDRFLDNARRHKHFKFNTDAIMRLLVYARLLDPCSKRATVLKKDQYFDRFDFSIDDVYAALTHFDHIAVNVQGHLHEQVTKQYKRTTDVVYYDVTNYYFEIDKEDDLRRRGAEKNYRRDPIVQMGLLLDQKAFPIGYKLYPGSTHDSQTLMPLLTEVKRDYGVKRLVTVADKALNSGDNIVYGTVLGDGYIYSKSVRGASAEFKAWLLDQEGYRQISDEFKIKSKIVPDAAVWVTEIAKDKRKTKKKYELAQKWVVYYSEKYARRARQKRNEAIAKAQAMIKNPAKYHRKLDEGAAGYIQNLKIDQETGEIISPKEHLVLDTLKITQEEKYDGYYAIVTSELDDSDEHIVDMYHQLWHIEESFKITKQTLETRPVFLQTPEHINAHFLICFIALLIARIVEYRLGGDDSIAAIVDTLNKISCSNIDQNHWLFDFSDKMTDRMNKVFGTNFGKKIMTLKEIKSSLGATKIR